MYYIFSEMELEIMLLFSMYLFFVFVRVQKFGLRIKICKLKFYYK